MEGNVRFVLYLRSRGHDVHVIAWPMEKTAEGGELPALPREHLIEEAAVAEPMQPVSMEGLGMEEQRRPQVDQISTEPYETEEPKPGFFQRLLTVRGCLTAVVLLLAVCGLLTICAVLTQGA